MSRCSLCGGEILDRSDSRYCVYCNSTFHRSCINEHFYRNKYCPVCNKKMSLIFMRYGSPHEPAVKKRPVPAEIRKPKWPQLERRSEVPVFDVDFSPGPLKRTDKYIPRAKGRGFRRVSRKVPTKLLAVVLVIAVVGAGVYFGRDYIPLSLPGEKSPESPWKVAWTYPLEGVSDIAASDSGIVVGSRMGFVVLGQDGTVLFQKEGDVSDVDISGDVIAIANRGVIEVYDLEGRELARYGEGACEVVSCSELGLIAVGLSNGGIVLIDMYGTVQAQYETGAVGSVSLSPDGAVTAYREGGTVSVLDNVLGEIRYAFEDGGSIANRIVVTSSGWVYAQAADIVYLYTGEGESAVWSAQAPQCEKVGLAVSQDATQLAVAADKAVIYSAADGELLYELPKGGCGGVAFSGNGVVVSDSTNVYFLNLEEEVPETGEAKPEESPEEEPEKKGELASYENWFTWYQSFISTEGSSAVYDVTVEEKEKTTQKMQVEYKIEGSEGENLIETVTMLIKAGEKELKTSFKRWITAEGTCTKAEMTIEDKVTPLKCEESTIRGIDLRGILSYQPQFEYMGQEEVTVGKGTFTCHKLQVTTSSGVLTLWITDDLPPIRITLQEGTTIVTMGLT